MMEQWERIFEITTGPEHRARLTTKPSLFQASSELPGAPGLKQMRPV